MNEHYHCSWYRVANGALVNTNKCIPSSKNWPKTRFQLTITAVGDNEEKNARKRLDQPLQEVN